MLPFRLFGSLTKAFLASGVALGINRNVQTYFQKYAQFSVFCSVALTIGFGMEHSEKLLILLQFYVIALSNSPR